MSAYLVHTNIISYLVDVDSHFHEKVREHFLCFNDRDTVALFVLTLYELNYSLAHTEGADIAPGILRIKEKHCAALPVVPLNAKGAEIFGALKSKYPKTSGLKKPLGCDLK